MSAKAERTTAPGRDEGPERDENDNCHADKREYQCKDCLVLEGFPEGFADLADTCIGIFLVNQVGQGLEFRIVHRPEV